MNKATDDEYTAARQSITLADLSNRTLIQVSGSDRKKFLHGQTTNDIKNLAEDTYHLNAMVNFQGRVQFIFFVIQKSDCIWIDADPNQGPAILAYLDHFLFSENVQIQIIQDYGHFYLQGPNTMAFINVLFPNCSNTPPLTLKKCLINIQNQIIECTTLQLDRWGEKGLSIYISNSHAKLFWNFLIETGKKWNLWPISDQTLETLRIESGWPMVNVDITQNDLLPESNLFSAISYDKGCYNGQEIIARLKTYGQLKHHLAGLTVDNHIDLLPQSKIYLNKKICSHITSTIYSPTLKKTCALAMLPIKTSDQKRIFEIEHNHQYYSAQYTELPFVKGSGCSYIQTSE